MRNQYKILAEKYELVQEAPYADPEKNRLRAAEYYLKNKDKVLKRNKEWNLKNPEHVKNYKKEWNLKNAEKMADYHKEYRLKNADVLQQKRNKNRESFNKSEREKNAEDRKIIVAASRQGNWIPWLEKNAIEKDKPSKEWRWEVTVDYLLEIWPKDNKCPILGTTFTLLDTKDYNPDGPSIDRINTNLHYVPGNVRIISRRANTIKNNGTANEINAVAEWMRVKGATPDPYFNEN